jgi:N-acetylneuraminic acid mutarotase
MRLALASLLAALVALIPLSVRAGQSSQRIPLSPTQSETQEIQLAGGGVPSGYMILGDTETPPPRYSSSGLTVWAFGDTPWSSAAPMLVARQELAAAVVSGKIYAIGGYGAGYLASVEEYSPETNSWTFRASMSTPRAELDVGVVDQKIYAIGGQDGAYLNMVEVFDPAMNIWSSRTPMPTPRDRHTTAVVNGKILVMGGYNGVALATVEEYDPASDTWTTKAPLPAPNAEASTVVWR